MKELEEIDPTSKGEANSQKSPLATGGIEATSQLESDVDDDKNGKIISNPNLNDEEKSELEEQKKAETETPELGHNFKQGKNNTQEYNGTTNARDIINEQKNITLVGPSTEDLKKLFTEKNNDSKESDKQNIDINDPTEPLVLKEVNLSESLKSHYTKSIYSQLKKRRILIVSCLHPPTTEKVVNAILNKHIPDNYEKRFLSYSSENRENAEKLEIDWFSSNYRKIGRNKEVAVKIAVRRDTLFQSLFQTGSDKDIFIEALKQKNFYLICYLHHAEWCEEIEQCKELPFLHWKLPFLQDLLEEHFDSKEATELIKRIEEQQKRGNWPQKETDLYRELVAILSKGKNYFKDILSKRELKKEVLIDSNLFRIEKKKGKVEVIDASSMSYLEIGRFLVNRSPINKFLFFVACYFPSLHYEEFSKLVQLIIQDEVILQKKKKKKKEVELITLWQEDPDTHLRNCGLSLIKSTDRKASITFIDSQLKSAIQNLLASEFPALNIETFKRIFYSAIYFSFDNSDQLEHHLLLLFSKTAIDDPFILGRKIMRDSFLLGEHKESEFNYSKLGEVSKKIVQIQLSRIIEAMLNRQDDDLNGEIKKFLNYLSEDKPVDLCFILGLIESSPHFDEQDWILKLLENNQLEVQETVFFSLIELLKKSPDRTYNYLNKMFSRWGLGKSNSENKEEHSTSTFGAFFLYYFSIVSYNQLEEKTIKNYPLFSTIKGKSNEQFKLLIQWLYHDKSKEAFIFLNIRNILNDVAKEEKKEEALLSKIYILKIYFHVSIPEKITEKSIDELEDFLIQQLRKILLTQYAESRASVFEIWGSLLLEFKEEDKDGVKLYTTFLETLSTELNYKESIQLRKEWEKKKASYLNQVKTFNRKEKEQRSQLLQSRATLRQLSTDFRATNKNLSKTNSL